MPFIPHTKDEVTRMLSTIGAENVDDLFDEIPSDLRLKNFPDEVGMSELDMLNLLSEAADKDGTPVCFAGAGAYDHHIPAAVWDIATRGEFYSSYTPYQAEASQGTLQLLYEYQTMMANLMAMDVSNTSMYDGASSLAESILMSIRSNRKSKSKQILMPVTVNPSYRKVVVNIVKNQKIELVEVPYIHENGTIDFDELDKYAEQDFAALVVPFPNYFGKLEEIDRLTDWAHANNMLLIAQVNPMAMSILKPPGLWGSKGADIVCGEGQPLGVPLSSGGPYFGFLCCTLKIVRQMPGRLIGKTEDTNGNTGYSLTLQAREQHIRRSKATSNICTNQGLLVTVATIYMSIMGESGLSQTATKSHQNTELLKDKLSKIEGVKPIFTGSNFHEIALSVPIAADLIIDKLADYNILAGVDLSKDYPSLGNSILVCATEKRTAKQMDLFVSKLQEILATNSI